MKTICVLAAVSVLGLQARLAAAEAGNPKPVVRARADVVENTLKTRWAKEVTPENVHPEYPRPTLVRAEWLNLNGSWDFGTSNLLQQLLARALASGRYAAHLEVLRRRYARKAAVMQGALRRHFPSRAEWWTPHGGLYCWARLPQRTASGVRSRLFHNALARDVLYVPGALCYADDPTRHKPNHELRLSFGGASEANIRLGIARLGASLRQLLGR